MRDAEIWYFSQILHLYKMHKPVYFETDPACQSLASMSLMFPRLFVLLCR